jgi:hypothetical protein
MEKEPIKVTEENLKKMMSVVMSELAKKGHKKSPRTKEFYQNMARARHNKAVDK